MQLLPRFAATVSVAIVILRSMTLSCADNNAQSETATCKSDDDDNDGNDERTSSCRLPPEPPPRHVVMPRDGPITATFRNDSPRYRADIYFDDGWFGQIVGTADADGGEATIDTFPFFRFFVTMHGGMEGLVDHETGDQYHFTIDKDNIAKGEQLFILPETAAPSATKCADRYPICAGGAKRGECKRNPGWMIVNCCKSCDDEEGFGYLLDDEVRCDPKRLNAAVPAWKDGSLNELFARWATDDAYERYEAHVISSPGRAHGAEYDGPWVMTFDNFLDGVEIGQLLEGASYGDGFQRSIDHVGNLEGAGETAKETSAYRTSSSAWCSQKCASLQGVQRITKRIEALTGIPDGNFESFQIVQYRKGQFYKSHHDSSSANKDRIAGHRVLTFLLYLNDVGEGGETRFTNLDITVTPKKGRALVWPSVLNEDPNTSDMRTTHEAMEVTGGIKYTANHWIHQYDFQNANLWGCTGFAREYSTQ